MNNKTNNNDIPVQALELLPWYAIGLLDGQDKKFVEKALLEFPELQAHLKIENEMAQYLKDEKDLFSLSAIEDREERLARLLECKEFESQNSEGQQVIISKKSSSFINFFQNLFSGQMSKTQYMGFAMVTTLSIALLFAFTVPLLEQNSTFYPAAVEINNEEKQNTNSLLIGLSVSPGDPRLLKILKNYGVKTTTIAGKDGMYRLVFEKKPSGLELDKLLSMLSKQTELVWFVGEAY